MSSQLGDSTAKCRPFYDIFDANRTFFCRNIVDYLNALWFFAFFTLLLWSIGTPVGLNLISLQQRLTSLTRAQKRAAERRASLQHVRDSRRHERGTSTPRERSTSSNTGRQRTQPQQLRRSSTAETLDLSLDEEGVAQQRERERDARSRERETSRSRGDGSAPTTPMRTRGRIQRSSGEDNWVPSGGQSRGASRERESSQARRTVSKPTMGRQSTESFDIDEEHSNSNDNWSPQAHQQQHHQQEQQSRRFEHRQDSSRREPIRRTTNDSNHTSGVIRNKPKLRHNEKESYERDKRRSMTPILPVRPDSHPALPLARTPTRLRNRVSLTTRAVANIVRASNSHNKPL